MDREREGKDVERPMETDGVGDRRKKILKIPEESREKERRGGRTEREAGGLSRVRED